MRGGDGHLIVVEESEEGDFRWTSGEQGIGDLHERARGRVVAELWVGLYVTISDAGLKSE